MVLESVEVSAVRNIEKGRLEASPALNVVIGPNASGKTSLLEAIHLACLARSFRTAKSSNVIRYGAEAAVVFARLREDSRIRRVGVRKARSGEWEIRLDGLRGTVADLARLTPLQVIAPGNQVLIEGGPDYRRRFLDWGAFHVEHGFHEAWQRLARTMRQRNAALRSGAAARAVEAWDEAVIEAGEQVTGARTRMVEALGDRLGSLIRELSGESFDVELRFRSGWRESETLGEALSRGLDRDRELGFTGVGPQRAELSIIVDGAAAAERLSRGQQKLLVIALRLAQMDVVREAVGQQCVVLVDDLPAELDRERRDRVMRMLAGRGAQAFVTATEDHLIDDVAWRERKVFHVEQGVLSSD